MERSCSLRAEPKARFPHFTEAAQCRRRHVWSSAGRLLRRLEAHLPTAPLRRSRVEEVQGILHFAQQRYAQESAFSQAALLGCLWYVLAIFQQDAGRNEDACAHFAAARPLLQRAVSRDTAWEALLQRFLLVCLVYEQRFEDALHLGKSFLQRRPRPPALLRLVGEILNQQGLRLEALPGSGRPSFERAAQLFAEAEESSAGHPQSYTSWALSHSMLGDLQAAEKVAMQAVERCSSGTFWVHPLQRPSHFLPQLYSSPWHRVEDFPWMKKLEDHWQEILAELHQLNACDACDASWPEVRGHDRSLAEGTGIWREFPLLGLQVDTESRCPRTWQLLTEVEAIASHWRLCPNEETALFSRLTPGTCLKPHCGPTNLHLTCHLGLEVPPGCRLRVGREWRSWQPGKCLVFDDSYEHEVQHHGDSTRIVLLVRFWHPQVPLEQREALLAQRLKQRKLKDWTLLS